jgi:hypothetical protein
MRLIAEISACSLILSSIGPLVEPARADDIVHKCIELSDAAVCSRSSGGALHCPRGMREKWVTECIKIGGKMPEGYVQRRGELRTLDYRPALESGYEPEHSEH